MRFNWAWADFTKEKKNINESTGREEKNTEGWVWRLFVRVCVWERHTHTHREKERDTEGTKARKQERQISDACLTSLIVTLEELR